MKYLLVLLFLFIACDTRPIPCMDELTTCPICGTSLSDVEIMCNDPIYTGTDKCYKRCNKCKVYNPCLPLNKCKK